ncbi:MAG: hypothetical protein JXM73_15950 [Anaerolineae bacterium]|nr:hypothetical protein [Anaerolineae bacterium]
MSSLPWEAHAAWLADVTTTRQLCLLAQQERALEQAKAGENREAQANAERQIASLCRQLIAKDPHTFRAYLEAIVSDSADVLRTQWQSQERERSQIAEGMAWLNRLDVVVSPLNSLSLLPPYSFALELHFRLARPYLSRDDDPFYVIDNPVRKDKVFQVPFVSSTSWKGGLRSVATRSLLHDYRPLLPGEPPADSAGRESLLPALWYERARRVMLFGNEKQSEARWLNRWLRPRLFRDPENEGPQDKADRVRGEIRSLQTSFERYLLDHHYRTEKIEGRQGRLFCFPTFFDQIALEMINPHDRERRVGTKPILFECVPAGTSGFFRLLYVPYDFPSQVTPDEAALKEHLQDNLPLVAQTAHTLLNVYGFGAKTSSGFGVIESKLPPTADGKPGGWLYLRDGQGRISPWWTKTINGLLKLSGAIKAKLEASRE